MLWIQPGRAKMLKFVWVFAWLLILGFPAVAQPEIPVAEEHTEIFIPLGYTEVLRFQSVIDTVKVVTKGAVEANPLTDRSIALTGIGIGSTIMLVYAPNGELLYKSRITVAASEPGHRVNVHSKPNAPHEYWAYYCTGTRCARVKDDLEGAPPDSRISRSTTIYVPGQGWTSQSSTERR
ncbi:MAG TPA: pilus assembly protein N-terminal domain-containing protein [Verrucomicrobiae bacterium]|nr:pilus assembly protein N-terminal domain-containing protein [Verrucomicrobiae bacterium]